MDFICYRFSMFSRINLLKFNIIFLSSFFIIYGI